MSAPSGGNISSAKRRTRRLRYADRRCKSLRPFAPLPMTTAVAVAVAAAAGLFRPVRLLRVPALVNGLLHDGPVVVADAAHEEHLDVVLDGHELRIVDPRFLRDVLAGIHFHADRFEPERRLVRQSDGLLALLEDDAVVVWFDAVLQAPELSIRQDGSALDSATVDHDMGWPKKNVSYTQLQWPSPFLMTMKRRKPVQTPLMWSCRRVSENLLPPPGMVPPFGSDHITLKTWAVVGQRGSSK